MTEGSIYHFSQHWFDAHIPRWEALLGPLRSQKIHVLEIGAFEGASTTWMLDFLLTHPDSRMVSIDSFGGGVEHKHASEDAYNLTTLRQRFEANLSLCAQRHKHCLRVGRSGEELVALRAANASFDLVYIDGSHMAADVLSDAVFSWSMLNEGGLLIFDDYQWDLYADAQHNPRIAIDAFMICYQDEIDVVFMGYQVFVRKIAAKTRLRRKIDGSAT